MKIINGKLVNIDSSDFDSKTTNFDDLSSLEENNNLEHLQLSIDDLELRINSLEKDFRHQLHQRIEILEKQTSKKLLAFAVISAVGFTSLGFWIGWKQAKTVPVANDSISELNQTSKGH